MVSELFSAHDWDFVNLFAKRNLFVPKTENIVFCDFKNKRGTEVLMYPKTLHVKTKLDIKLVTG